MSNTILDGLTLIDTNGRLILAATGASLFGAVAAHVFLRARYAGIERDLRRNGDPSPQFESPVLRRIVHDAERAVQRSGEASTQAIIEDDFQSELKSLLLAERFVRGATGLVLVLGLLGTFYGLTMSIGKLVGVLTGDSGAVVDVSQAITLGLTDALSGMAIAFSNSLLGVGAAVVLTALGILNNVTDQRTGLMVQIETYLDRTLPKSRPHDAPLGSVGEFNSSVARLDTVVARLESAMLRFVTSTNDLRKVQLVVALKSSDEQ